MTELDQAIAKAMASTGKVEDVNQAYLILLRTSLFIPVEKEKDPTSDEPFRPLFLKADNHYFVLAFDGVERLSQWADDQLDKMDYVELSGHDLILGLNDNVYLCVNYGTPYYKEFPPDEIKHLKKIVTRIDQMRSSSGSSDA